MKRILSTLATNAIHYGLKTPRVLMLFVFFYPLISAAQDVIVKQDGGTVVCRIVEVGQSEVVYKRWTELQGNNYVMSIKDISTINYENGQKVDFNTATAVNSPLLGTPGQPLDDATLLAMANKSSNNAKARKLKIAGWVSGSLLVVAGVTCMGIGGSNISYNNSSLTYSYYDGDNESDIALLSVGAIFTAGGIALTSGCLVKARKLTNESVYDVKSIPMVQNTFNLKNGAKLTANVNSIKDKTGRNSTFGLGINYNF